MSKTYLITGGTSGIGKAVACKMLECSDPEDTVIVTYGHNDSAAEEFIADVNKKNRDRVRMIKSDLSVRRNIDAFITELHDISACIDYAVFNIGIGTNKPFIDYDFEDWDKVLETNLTIPVFLIQRLMRESLIKDSSIVLTGSLVGLYPHGSSVAYGISKAGLMFVAKSLIKELEAFRTRINAVAPGFTKTPWHDKRSEESFARINRKIAAHRFGKPEEIADMIVAILHNGYMNGSIVTVDGGYDYF